jgi:hypothetical protein
VVTDVTISVKPAVVLIPPPVPLKLTIVVLPGALGETAKDSTEPVMPPAGGVTGLGEKPPVTPEGNVGIDRVTGELKEPVDCTVTAMVDTAPGSRVRLSGLMDIVNSPTVAVVVVVVTAVTVNVPLADFPVLPIAITVYPPGVALDDTVNPTLMFPPPMMVQGGLDEENNPGGPEIS